MGGVSRTAAVLLTAALAPVGCGGEDQTSPDSREKSGSFQVELTRASFPARQRVAGTADLVLAVRNTGGETIPQLAVTLWTGRADAAGSKPQGSFNVRVDERDRASTTSPVWIPTPGYPKLLAPGKTLQDLGAAPSAGGVAAQIDTYVLGALPAGKSKTIVWRVTPIRAGSYTVRYAVAAGLRGEAKAVAAGGEPVGGAFRVRIGSDPGGQL